MEAHHVTNNAHASVSAEVMALANRLAAKHGPVTIARESSGIQIYIPNPKLLHTDGPKELQSKHIAVNADLYLGTGPYDVNVHPTVENKRRYRRYYSKSKVPPCAMCMKTREVFSVADLLQYRPVAEREYKLGNIQARVTVGAVKKRLVPDGNGNMVPEWCGETVRISSLPLDHPAQQYLISRGFNVALTEQHLDIWYCTQALPESQAEGRYYSRLPDGLKNTPEGRIIFPIYVQGVRVGYQSRYIDRWEGDHYYFWSHQRGWVWIRTRVSAVETREAYPPCDVFRKGFSPHKYLNAVGTERNKLLMGYDAAVAYNVGRPLGKRYCVLVEGPLDAARIGPPGIAILGSVLSPEQVELLIKEFDHIIFVADQDKAGLALKAKMPTLFPSTPVSYVNLPEGSKDLGEHTYMEAYELITPHVPV